MDEKKNPLTADDVMRGLGGRTNSTKWNITPPNDADRAKADGPQIVIANVSPESWTVALGNLGTFVIPACTERSLGILHINRIVFDTEIDVEKTVNVQDFEGGPWRMVPAFKHIPIDGMEVAKEIVGTAKYRHPPTDLTRWGVFIVEGTEATREEIEAAHRQLHKSYSGMVREIKDFIEGGDILNVSDRHINALRYVWWRGGRLTQ